MNHLSENELVLLAYGESPQAGELESHVAACEVCRAALEQIERARVALDDSMPPVAYRRARPRWAVIALAAAAVLAAVLLMRSRPTRDPAPHWSSTTTWSTTAGYVTGGKPMMDIDAQLTRLEQGRYYGLPN